MATSDQKSLSIEDVLTNTQVNNIVKKCIGDTESWQLVRTELKPATDGSSGVLGDLYRLVLTVQVGDRLVSLPLFVKSLPLDHSSKAAFMEENNLFRREMVIFKLMEDLEIENGDSNPWGVKAVLYDSSRIVMPDLTAQGYSTLDHLQTLDLAHVRIALTSVARFHAATAALGSSPIFDYQERHYKDTPWIHSGAKLTKDLINKFSKHKDVPDLEAKLLTQFLKACGDIKVYNETLNIIIHKDLWVHNIMFKYENGEPSNAVILDFQCVRYAPPAFDVTTLLYLTTSRSFREKHESEVLVHYFETFIASLDAAMRVKIESLGYNFASFLQWVEQSRKFGMLQAIMILPYVLMERGRARAMFDDPALFAKYTNEDRSVPVLAEARRSPLYLERQLEVCEEFIERYLNE